MPPNLRSSAKTSSRSSSWGEFGRSLLRGMILPAFGIGLIVILNIMPNESSVPRSPPERPPARSQAECAELRKVPQRAWELPFTDIYTATFFIEQRLECEGRYDEASALSQLKFASVQEFPRLSAGFISECTKRSARTLAEIQSCGEWAAEEARRTATSPLRAMLRRLAY